MQTREETALRKEIEAEVARLRPTWRAWDRLDVIWVGRLLDDGPLEAIVEDAWGQCLWSFYKKEHGIAAERKAAANPPSEKKPEDLPGQLTFF